MSGTAIFSQGLRYRGAWDVAAAYNTGDIVSSNQATYVCIVAHNGHTPPNLAYWDVSLFAASSGGASGTNLWTIVTAADVSSSAITASTPYVCDGTADQVEINAAITALNAAALPAGGIAFHGGTVLLVGRQFNQSTEVLLTDAIDLWGQGNRTTMLARAANSTMTAQIKLTDANVERVHLKNFCIFGNTVGNTTAADAISLDNTGGTFFRGPDTIHRVSDLDIYVPYGNGISMIGTNNRGALVKSIRIESAGQHGFHIPSGVDGKYEQCIVLGAGVLHDDGLMAYNAWNVLGASNEFVGCRGDFARGRGWMLNCVRGNWSACNAFDNWGAGVEVGSNANGVRGDFVIDSAMFPQAGIEGSDAGLFIQGGFDQITAIINDRGFAPGQIDASGNYGSVMKYGCRIKDSFGNGINLTIVSRNTQVDSIVGAGRAAAGTFHNLIVQSDVTVSQVAYLNLPKATGGNFTITDPDSGLTTAPITFSTTAATLATNVHDALRALAPFIGDGTTTGSNTNAVASGNQSYQIKISLRLGLANVARTQFTVNGSGLTGVGASAAAAVLPGINGGPRTSEYRIGHGPVYIAAPMTVPTDSLVMPGSYTPYEDPTTHHLMLRYNNNAGTLKTIDLGVGV